MDLLEITARYSEFEIFESEIVSAENPLKTRIFEKLTKKKERVISYNLERSYPREINSFWKNIVEVEKIGFLAHILSRHTEYFPCRNAGEPNEKLRKKMKKFQTKGNISKTLKFSIRSENLFEKTSPNTKRYTETDPSKHVHYRVKKQPLNIGDATSMEKKLSQLTEISRKIPSNKNISFRDLLSAQKLCR